MVTITGVEKGSAAEKAGILTGDVLLCIDTHPIKDVLDYRFFLTEERITLTLKRGEEEFDVVLKKGRYDDIGLDFETFLMDKKRRCSNKCIFCFIDQNPCGMRETVYFKDDDTRLSFLMGNYVTLTNVSDEELGRIVSMHMSPVNVSVHTTDPALRVKMLGNPRAARIMDQLRILTEGGIRINCQIVSCCGINDGPALRHSLRELISLGDMVESIAVVPAGLTRHRAGLYPLQPYEKASAEEVIAIVEKFAEDCSARFDRRMVYAADEFYLMAQKEFPPEEAYDGYPQLDNGVGLIRSTREEFLDELYWRRDEGQLEPYKEKALRATLVTGFAARDLMEELCEEIGRILPRVKITVLPVKNEFFGDSVTVAGLICGGDLIEAVKKTEPELVILPAVALRHERDKFLDDVTLEQVREALDCPVYAVENGIPLLDALEELLKGGC